ncbi:MAG: hypothetical protein NTY25_14995, partial [Planctomycetia bacterium]|nr:hypothetical protein [Planctomycetia bacterium]
AAGRFQKVRTEDVSPKKSRIALEAVEAVGGRVQVAVEPTDAQRTRCDLKSVTVQDEARLLSMSGENLAVGFPGTGRIEWLATSPGLPTEGKAIVPDLKGIALRSDGLVIAISGSSLVEVTANQPPVIRVTDLPNPILIAADAKSGGVFVASGEGNWQVRRYDRDWKLTGTFGRAGGRQTGLYHPEDFKNIRCLTADGQGGFLVLENECAPRRVARFDATGTLVQEWNGGQLFFTLASGDPVDPTRVWLNSHWGWMMEAQVDYDARTSSSIDCTGCSRNPMPAIRSSGRGSPCDQSPMQPWQRAFETLWRRASMRSIRWCFMNCDRRCPPHSGRWQKFTRGS